MSDPVRDVIPRAPGVLAVARRMEGQGVLRLKPVDIPGLETYSVYHIERSPAPAVHNLPEKQVKP